jgi:Galactose oxidase, central domain
MIVGCSLLFATDDFAGAATEGRPGQPPDDASFPTADVIQSTMPAMRNRQEIVVVDDRLYVLGGEAPGGGFSSDVFVGDLTPDGNVTTWRSTTPLPMPLVHHNAVVVR